MRQLLSPAILLSLLLLPGSAGAVTSNVTFVTRAEAVMILLNNSTQRFSQITTSEQTFSDVPGTEWYAPYMKAGVALHLITPASGTRAVFPLRSITRAEFLQMLVRLHDLPLNQPYTFTDVVQNTWYAPYAGIAERYMLFVEDGTLLHPEYRLTHLEAVYALQRLFIAQPELRPSVVAILRRIARSSSLRSPSAVSSSSQSSPPLAASSASAGFTPVLSPGVTNRLEKSKLEVISRVNEERTREGLPPLKRNYLLEEAAQKHAKDMYQRDYFSHFTPEGLSYVDRIRAAGYLTAGSETCSCQPFFDLTSDDAPPEEHGPNYLVTQAQKICNCEPQFAVGENLIKGILTPEIAVRDWLDSTPHRLTMLQSKFEETGVGIYGDVWVQTFGSVKFR
ncbi:MAG: CAP domain-containing protein [Candidatus Peribacteraceae bacterium]|nr:CAP domain-containing protein [Candidatus Peribacteraceae bacterium]